MVNIKSQPFILILFGGSGDLAARKIIPGLYNLFLDGWLPDQFTIIGNGRRKLSDADFRDKLLDGINKFSRKGKAAADKWTDFSARIFYQSANVNDAGAYKAFGVSIQQHREEWKKEANVIYYLAVSSNFFEVITENISKNKLAENPERDRIVIEKPFGRDLESAKTLNKHLGTLFQEKQIYRIDHYLGKETVQNIMAFRFANSIFEPLWNRNYIEHVQISVFEKLGVEERGEYYEGAGALRDMIQNHLLQLLCFIAMEIPVNFSADEVRDRKVDVLKAMRKFSAEDIRTNAVRGQYGGGQIDGKEVPAYRAEPKINPASNTETFAAVKFFIDNWRWHTVPFYLRTGKRMQQASSIISIQFRDIPPLMFPCEATNTGRQNRLNISIQPEMSIRLQLQTKRPGLDMALDNMEMVFDYNAAAVKEIPEAYETLLLEIMTGDQTLFVRADQAEAEWEIVTPILNAWESEKSEDFPNYAAGSTGPEAAERLTALDGFHWFLNPLIDKT